MSVGMQVFSTHSHKEDVVKNSGSSGNESSLDSLGILGYRRGKEVFLEKRFDDGTWRSLPFYLDQMLASDI